MYDKEIRKEMRLALKQAKAEIIEQMKKRQMLVNANTDFAMLEQFIQSVNTNPGLVITFTTKDGCRTQEDLHRNPGGNEWRIIMNCSK